VTNPLSRRHQRSLVLTADHPRADTPEALHPYQYNAQPAGASDDQQQPESPHHAGDRFPLRERPRAHDRIGD
jgi:hypothetical protein